MKSTEIERLENDKMLVRESRERGRKKDIESQMLYALSFLMHLPGTVNRKKCEENW